MSQYKKKNNRKTSSRSSENNVDQNIEYPMRQMSSSSEASMKKQLIYPNVPKRRSNASSLMTANEQIQSHSQIYITSPDIQSQQHKKYSSNISSANQNAYVRHTLDLITKYTSPKKQYPKEIRTSDGMISSQPAYRLTCKRTLSPLDEVNDSKRTKSFDTGDASDDELCVFLDNRTSKKFLSQTAQLKVENEQARPTVRKPTSRKLSNTRTKSSIMSQAGAVEQSVKNINNDHDEILIVESNIDHHEEAAYNSKELNGLSIHSPINFSEQSNISKSPPRIFSPVQIDDDDATDRAATPVDQVSCNTPTKSTNAACESSIVVVKRTPEKPNLHRRRHSSTSTNSCLFDTPCSSISRTTMHNRMSASKLTIKNDSTTQTSCLSNMDIMNQLILQMNTNMDESEKEIDYDAIELSKKLFYQYRSGFSSNKYPTINSLVKKQFLNFGRYEIEIVFPISSNKIPIIYVCDICLKHFYDSSVAYQRHIAKCLSLQPPGKIVYHEKDLAIFEIGDTKLNIEQRIYIKSLCRIARLFMDSHKSVDDRKVDRFVYYVLCRRDPILSEYQPSLYRFVGYFSKQVNHHAQQSINNLSCLFILPPFARHQQYNQLLIAFSYFLVRSNTSKNLIYCSPARPLDIMPLSAFQNYWRDVVLTYIINHNQSSIKTITLDTLARQTFIHPRDIISSLYYNDCIIPHPTDKSSVYLNNNAYQLMTSINSTVGYKLLFMHLKLGDTNDEKKTVADKKK